MARRLLCIAALCGLLIGIARVSSGAGAADAVADLRRPVEQTALAAALFSVALYLHVRDGGTIIVPTSPVELW